MRSELGLGGGEVVVGHDTVPHSPVAVSLNTEVVGAAHDAEPTLLTPLRMKGEHGIQCWKHEQSNKRCTYISTPRVAANPVVDAVLDTPSSDRDLVVKSLDANQGSQTVDGNAMCND